MIEVSSIEELWDRILNPKNSDKAVIKLVDEVMKVYLLEPIEDREAVVNELKDWTVKYPKVEDRPLFLDCQNPY